jgi:hypothetical protein
VIRGPESAARSTRPRTGHVPLDRSLCDADAELQEFSANAFGSPQPALGRHAPDERDDIESDARFAGAGRAAYSTPQDTESRTVLSKHGLLHRPLQSDYLHRHWSLSDAASRASGRRRPWNTAVNDHDVGRDAIEDRIGWECPNGAPPNVAVDFGEGARRFGNEFEGRSHL